MLVHEGFLGTAARLPDKVALVTGGEGGGAGGGALTYGAIAEQVARLAGFLQARGVERGDRVMIFLPNGAEAVVALYAASRVGAAFVLVHPQTKAAKLRHLVEDAAPAAFVGAAPLAHVWRPALAEAGARGAAPRVVVSVRARAPDPEDAAHFEAIVAGEAAPLRDPGTIDADLAALIYTSGSTGEPKGVMLSHLNVQSAARSVLAYLPLSEEDRILSALPLPFGYGLYQILMAFQLGATVLLEASLAFPAKTLDTMRRLRATVFPGVPTMFTLLSDHPTFSSEALPDLRLLTNAAAAISETQIRIFRERLPGARFYSMYGQTECKRASYLPPEELERRPTSVGRGMPNQEHFLVDDEGRRLPWGSTGELVVRGSHVMRGYWRKPEETAQKLRPGAYAGDVQLHTGDVFRTDAEGFLYFVGRKDDLVKTRGERVSPREIENVIASLEGVALVAVVGVPDPLLGEALKAYVVPRDGARVDPQAVVRHCASQLENFMVPKYVELRDHLPMTDTGKIRKLDLKADPPKPSP
jgi:amino acid adenylation domain-containing protein